MRIALTEIDRIGTDLQRCEGVMCARDGTVWAADGRGGCTWISADGAREGRVGDVGGEPNGICLDREGRVVIANLHGDVQRLDPSTRRPEVRARPAGRPPAPAT